LGVAIPLDDFFCPDPSLNLSLFGYIFKVRAGTPSGRSLERGRGVSMVERGAVIPDAYRAS
jgi:hypothetical protein